MPDHFVVCGMGQVGYRVVQLLLRLGEAVTVVTVQPRPEWLEAIRAAGATVHLGDARDRDRLLAAGLLEARALLALTSQDLVNIEVALDARQLRADLPVVIRVFDPTLAHQLEVSFDVRRAVGMSALSAPVLAGAALGEQLVGSFTLDGALFVVGHLALDAASPLAGRSVQQVRAAHGLAALVRGAADQPPEIVPSPDVALAAGDRVTVVGTAAAWDSATWDTRLAEAQASAIGRGLHRLHSALSPAQALDFLRQAWATTSVGLRTVFVLLNLLILLSVFVFHAAMELSWDDALYFVVTTVTTVGYGDITPRDAHTGVKLYAVLLMVLGSATIATLYSIITDFIVTARFQQLLGRQRVPNQDHIVVVGLGNVGYRVVDELRRARVGVVAIERDAAGRSSRPSAPTRR